MAFEVKVAERTAGDRTGAVYELSDTAGTVRAEVWPNWGFNCINWQVRQPDGRWADVMFHMPDWETNPVPTRSGNPILFPFPGRLRDGRFTFEGQKYQLPLTDNTKLHSIHGFTPRNRWSVAASSGTAESAAVTGEFTLGTNFPEALAYWPADFRLNVTYRLFTDRLRIEARVENLGTGALPFGLGYHGYFCLPGVSDADISNYVLQANVKDYWEPDGILPSGNQKSPPAEIDFRSPRPLGATALDNAFTGVTTAVDSTTGLRELARLTHPAAAGGLRILADGSFRELVLFTPVHRRAIAIEPYTCSADASNLAARGIDSGWRVIGKGGHWEGTVEYRWEPGRA